MAVVVFSSLVHCVTVGRCAGVVYDQALAQAVANVEDELRYTTRIIIKNYADKKETKFSS
jgi:hypothetical protein